VYKEFMQNLISLSLALFILMDPIGNIPLFSVLLKGFSPKRQRRIILRELLIALGVILLFVFFGDFIFDLLQVKEDAVLIAGATILFLISLKMIFPPEKTGKEPLAKEPFIVPLAIPLVAGPAVLTSVMLYARQNPNSLVITAICIAWIASAILLLGSSFLKHWIGEKGLLVGERLMGLLLTILAVQMFLKGLRYFLNIPK
jgi:multiple antibiotic resistance protein